MPTNANTFNSRVTSEALEAKFRQVFPAQGGAELVQDLFASGVIQPVIDFSSVAEGSILPVFLQRAYDFSTGKTTANNSQSNIITTTGFWQIKINCSTNSSSATTNQVLVGMTDGVSTKPIWAWDGKNSGGVDNSNTIVDEIVVFVRSGDTVYIDSNNAQQTITANYRQIADVYGNLVNPLGFVFT